MSTNSHTHLNKTNKTFGIIQLNNTTIKHILNLTLIKHILNNKL